MFVHHYHGVVYHYLVPHARRNDWDSTLCSHPLPSQNGVNVWTHFLGGMPTPTITTLPPPGLPLCQHCARQVAKRLGKVQR